MEARDLEAMRRAIATLRSDHELGPSVEAMLRDRGEQQTGEWAAGVLQVQALKLKPWEAAPSSTVDTKNPADVYGYRPREVGLLRRLLAAGLSRFEPDPLGALAASESKPAA
jgi:hypothetical protein